MPATLASLATSAALSTLPGWPAVDRDPAFLNPEQWFKGHHRYFWKAIIFHIKLLCARIVRAPSAVVLWSLDLGLGGSRSNAAQCPVSPNLWLHATGLHVDEIQLGILPLHVSSTATVASGEYAC